MRPRWDIDERGEGVGDAGRLLPEARALVERMGTPHWITEDADAHLLPHLRRMCERREVPLELLDARVEQLLGRIAEPGTFVEKRETGQGLELDMVTGVVSDEGRYATHGHTVHLRVTA